MSESLFSDERVCFICKTPFNIHRHHIYAGANRNTSEKYGAWVYLCANHHNMSNYGVHNDPKLDKMFKELAQAKWEQKYGSREDFIKAFRKSYL